MEEELTGKFQKFALSEKEEKGVKLEEVDVNLAKNECKQSLLGRIYGNKISNFMGVKNFVNHVWKSPKNLRVVELGRNLFQFTFEMRDDMLKVWVGRPWLMENQILVLQKWEEGIEEKAEAFEVSLMWVQAWNLPIHWLTMDTGRKIGGAVGKVLRIMVPQVGGKEGRHLKFFVEVNLREPLLRGFNVKLNGITKWVEFKYEKCADFCYNCGRIGHGEKNCGGEVDDLEGWGEGTNKKKEYQYGPWLRVEPKRVGSAGKGGVITNDDDNTGKMVNQLGGASMNNLGGNRGLAQGPGVINTQQVVERDQLIDQGEGSSRMNLRGEVNEGEKTDTDLLTPIVLTQEKNMGNLEVSGENRERDLVEVLYTKMDIAVDRGHESLLLREESREVGNDKNNGMEVGPDKTEECEEVDIKCKQLSRRPRILPKSVRLPLQGITTNLPEQWELGKRKFELRDEEEGSIEEDMEEGDTLNRQNNKRRATNMQKAMGTSLIGFPTFQ